MTQQFPDGFEGDPGANGEFRGDPITFQSRLIDVIDPNSPMWPMELHDDKIKAAAEEQLPKMVAALSEPVVPATQEQVADIFDRNPGNRRTGWTFRSGDAGEYVFSSSQYTHDRDLHNGINYTFNNEGRLIKTEYIGNNDTYDRGKSVGQTWFTYDDEGFLTERHTWEKYRPVTIDRFSYDVDESGTRTPKTMERVIQQEGKEGAPMLVDLANYQEWFETNPNGYRAINKESLEPKELEIEGFEVCERRSGIKFEHPEQVEHALVMYGNGSYPTPGGKTALEHNDDAFAESAGPLGGALFSMMSRRGDMNEFVNSRITTDVFEKWNKVQESKDADASASVGFSFDYDGAGHFHKTSGDIKITKEGLVLTLNAAYVGDQVEDQLASALGKKRGLQSATISVPINQSSRDDYFLVDVQAASERIGVPISGEYLDAYLADYLGETEATAGLSAYDRKYRTRPAMWSDSDRGITAKLVTTMTDYNSHTELSDHFSRDEISFWGPLPKALHVEEGSEPKGNQPKIVITIEPKGDPFDQATSDATDAIVKGYITNLEEAA